MTPEQYVILRADFFASVDPLVIAARNDRNDSELARLYNEPTTFTAWRNGVGQDEIMQNGFDWVRVDNLSVGRARIWEWLFANQSKTINPSKPNVRAGIDEAWKGTTADLAVRAAVYLHCKRFASRAEKVFATGLGLDATPGTLNWEGMLDSSMVARAINGD